MNPQLAAFAAQGLAARQEAYGVTIIFRGAAVTATVSPATARFLVVDGGIETQIDSTMGVALDAISPAPRRWERVTLPDGRVLVIGESRRDDVRLEWVLDLVSPQT